MKTKLSDIISNTNQLVLKHKYLLLPLIVFNLSIQLLQQFSIQLGISEQSNVLILLVNLSLIFVYSGNIAMQLNVLKNPREANIEDFIHGLLTYAFRIFIYGLLLFLAIIFFSFIVTIVTILTRNITAFYIVTGFLILGMMIFSIKASFILQIMACENKKVIESLKLSFKFTKENLGKVILIFLFQTVPIMILLAYTFSKIDFTSYQAPSGDISLIEILSSLLIAALSGYVGILKMNLFYNSKDKETNKLETTENI